MIIWRGFGVLVILILFFVSLFTEIITEYLTVDENFYQESPYPIALAFFIAGLINFFLGRYLNGKEKRIYIDKETGEEVELDENHTLFLMPMEYWGILFFVGSILMLFF